MRLRAKRAYLRHPLTEVRAEFLAIFQKMNPGKDSPAQVYGHDFWKYLDIYCRLRLRNHAQIVDAMATSFAGTCERKNKEKHALEEIIIAQRKRLAELERPWEKKPAPPYVPPAHIPAELLAAANKYMEAGDYLDAEYERDGRRVPVSELLADFAHKNLSRA